MNVNARCTRPIWRCGKKTCALYNTKETALIQKPSTSRLCPRCGTAIEDYCTTHKVFHRAHGFVKICKAYESNKGTNNPEKRRVAQTSSSKREVGKKVEVATVIVTPKPYQTRSTHTIVVDEGDAGSENNNSEKNVLSRSNLRTDLQQQNINLAYASSTNEVKCGLCLRLQVKDFCHQIPGCSNDDRLCMVCYPRWLTVWHQQSQNKKELPCPICRTGSISWEAALDPYRQDFIVMSLLQK